jgi:hypothetical protein
MPLNEEEQLFADAVDAKLEKYRQLASTTDDPIAAEKIKDSLRFVPALLAGYKKDQGNKELLRDKISLYIQGAKAWKPTQTVGEVITNKDDVRRAVAWQELRLDGVRYMVGPSGKGVTRPRGVAEEEANGGYCFVVLVAKPRRILLAARATGGHTTISHGAGVLYAGELFFDNGALTNWNNDSGHYRPDELLKRQVEHLLPLEKFTPRPA